MTLSRSETELLFDLVLGADIKDARNALYEKLRFMGRSEPEFYAGVLEFCVQLKYGSDQWSDLLAKIPDRIFRYEPRIMNKLSELQREALPPAVFEAR